MTELKFTADLTTRSAVTLPARKTSRSAGMDFCVADDVVLEPGQVARVSLGLMFAEPLDADVVLILAPRSSLFKNYGVLLTNSVGIIDADFPGTLQAEFLNVSPYAVQIRAGTAVLQGVVVNHLPVTPVFAPRDQAAFDALDRTGGFGSTDTMDRIETVPTDAEGTE